MRREIIAIHLHKRSLDPRGFDLDVLATASEGFTGAGIEQAIVSAIYAGRASHSEPSTESIHTQLDATQPLSVVMEAQISQLRHWAQGRTVAA